MRAHPHLVHPRQQQHYAESMQSGSSSGIVLPPEPMKKHKRPMGGPYLPQQRSYSSSDEDIRSTPEYEGQFARLLSFNLSVQMMIFFLFDFHSSLKLLFVFLIPNFTEINSVSNYVR